MTRAVVAKRVDSGSADLAEIRELARAAGYEVVGELTQTRTEDAAYHFGEGKVDELARLVTDREAEVVVVDNRLGPYQTYNVGRTLPEGVEVVDRFTLILEIFGQRAQTRKAQLQVELAELRYELPRAEAKASLAKRDERPGFMGLGEYDESRERDIKAQISRIKDELDAIADKEETRRERRRESGFDLVALAGYTNAGKSTLLRRLADDLDVDENEGLHPDLDATAESEDRLFTTLGTTTRRADVGIRDVLVTDTVGFVSDLPHWLVESFESTLPPQSLDFVCNPLANQVDVGPLEVRKRDLARVATGETERPVHRLIDEESPSHEGCDVISGVILGQVGGLHIPYQQRGRRFDDVSTVRRRGGILLAIVDEGRGTDGSSPLELFRQIVDRRDVAHVEVQPVSTKRE